MPSVDSFVSRLAERLHHHLLPSLLAAYALATVLPGPGLWLRSAETGRLVAFGLEHVSLTSLLLSGLLFIAGIGIRSERIVRLARQPLPLIAGVATNLVLPVAFILATARTLHLWHNPREVQEILVGLALIASMPIAGSSTAWAQNGDGDLALSIGLVVASTCASPWTTPLVLDAVGWIASGQYAETLHRLASHGVGRFLAVNVLAPSLLGIATRLALGERAGEPIRPALKACSSVIVLVLCYANAAVVLPQTARRPDWDLLAVMGLIVLLMCGAGFLAGALVGRLCGVDRSQRTALMFGLGMTNNGTGLVVAAGALAHMPAVLLPILFYNLVQHVVASAVDRWAAPRSGAAPA